MGKRYVGPEKREFPRLMVKLAVLYQINKPLFARMQIGGKEVLATTIDLAEGGAAILTDYDIPIGAVLSISLTIYGVNASNQVDTYGPIKLVGEVRSNSILEEERYRLGINFIEMGNEDKDVISKFVKKYLIRR